VDDIADYYEPGSYEYNILTARGLVLHTGEKQRLLVELEKKRKAKGEYEKQVQGNMGKGYLNLVKTDQKAIPDFGRKQLLDFSKPQGRRVLTGF
jgi:hypothetical protein